MKYMLNKKQKAYLWDILNMGEVYIDNPKCDFARLETCIDYDWYITENHNCWADDYPYTLNMCLGSWDDITSECWNSILKMEV